MLPERKTASVVVTAGDVEVINLESVALYLELTFDTESLPNEGSVPFGLLSSIFVYWNLCRIRK